MIFALSLLGAGYLLLLHSKEEEQRRLNITWTEAAAAAEEERSEALRRKKFTWECQYRRAQEEVREWLDGGNTAEEWLASQKDHPDYPVMAQYYGDRELHAPPTGAGTVHDLHAWYTILALLQADLCPDEDDEPDDHYGVGNDFCSGLG